MSARRWVARFLPDVDPAPDPNPLAVGAFCDICGCRLDRADRPCPFSPHDRRRS